MTRQQIDQISILACITGLVLVAAWFIALAVTGETPDTLAMLASAVGGFELFHFGQGVFTARARRSRGR